MSVRRWQILTGGYLLWTILSCTTLPGAGVFLGGVMVAGLAARLAYDGVEMGGA